MITPADVDNGSNDECGDVTLGLSQTDFDCSNIGDNEVTLTVDDPCGNQTTCTATVSVQDTLNPTAVCQSLFLYLDATGNASITPEDIDDGSSDNCGTVNLISVTPSAFTCDNVGPNSVTLLVEDGEGNQDSCNSIVTVLDTISPVMACQDVIVYLDAAGSASITTEDVDNGITDNCGDFTTVSLTPNTFACEDVFNTNNVTLTVEDASGNSSSCDLTVTVLDTIFPTANCQDISVYLDENGMAPLEPEQVDGGSFDNCLPISLSVLPNMFTCDDLGDNMVTLEVKDTSLNISTCMATVTVVDTIAPELNCIPGVAELDINGNVVVDEDVIEGSVLTDNCTNGLSFVSGTPTSFDCSQVGPQAVTFVFSDGSGNTTSCTTTVDVQDNLDPIAVCQDITVNLLGNGTVSINPGEVDGGSFDNCATYTYVGVTPSTFDCDDIGPNPVTLTVVDNSGNTSSCTATVTVQDLIAPIAICQDITVSLDTNGMVMIDPAQIDNGSTDNCGVVNFDTLAPSAFTCDNIGGNLVTLTISDESDNVSTCTAIVTVEDNEPPVAGCQDITVQLDDFTGTITITPDQVENGSTDNCSPVVTPVSVTPDFFECGLIGPNIVELTVEDDLEIALPVPQRLRLRMLPHLWPYALMRRYILEETEQPVLLLRMWMAEALITVV
jgi:hypothetical protein